MGSGDESLLDVLGTLAVAAGLFVLFYGVASSETSIIETVQAAQPLVVVGFAAIAGGGVLKGYLKRK